MLPQIQALAIIVLESIPKAARHIELLIGHRQVCKHVLYSQYIQLRLQWWSEINSKQMLKVIVWAHQVQQQWKPWTSCTSCGPSTACNALLVVSSAQGGGQEYLHLVEDVVRLLGRL